MLTVLHTFCECNGMVVNTKKSEVVVFNSSHCCRSGKVAIRYDNAMLPVKDEFTYLGLKYSDAAGAKHAALKLLEKGRAAMYAMVRKCNTLAMHNVHMRCKLFDALVRPIFTFGAEVWGPCALLACIMSSRPSGVLHDMEGLHKDFLMQCLHVSKSVPNIVMMCEMERWPIWIQVLKAVVRFLNRVCGRDNQDIVKMAMVESGEDEFSGCSWVANMRRCMHRLEVQVNAGQYLNEALILDKAKALYLARLGNIDGVDSVRRVPDHLSKDFKAITYLSWFASDMGPKGKFWYHLNRADFISVVARYRLGNSWLEIESGRYRRIPRSQRVCPCSTCRGVPRREDEAHLLVCPLYEQLRAKYRFHLSDISGDDEDDWAELRVREFMDVPEDPRRYWGRVAGFLLCSKRLRDDDLKQQGTSNVLAAMHMGPVVG